MKKIVYTALASILFCGALNAETTVKPSHTAIAASPTINLNKADVDTLSHSFKGIGTKRAEAIVRYREAHHGFQSVADLAKVPGIGNNFVNKHLARLEKTFTVK